MATDRLVRWSEEAQSFFSSARNESLVLDVVISHACLSQTWFNFEDLVNSLNSDEIRRKIKKVDITDTSYLYRHCIPEFAGYVDSNVPTLWLLNNKLFVDRLNVAVEIKSWAENISGDEFKLWHQRILTDYEVEREFRELAIADSSVAAYKNSRSLQDCIGFILEECAYACAFLRNANLVYPMNLARCMLKAFELHNVNVVHLIYKTSKLSQKQSKRRELRSSMLDREISTFMKEKVSNVNFFVIDKFGDHIYKNYSLDAIVGNTNAKELTEQSWKITSEVMERREQTIVEETYKGATYLSVKAPLMIDGEVEGVIGLAIDITDRKKAQDLEIKNKIFKNQRILAEQVAHDITSPLLVLKKLAENCKSLSEKEHIALRNSVMAIESMTEDLIKKYV